MTDALSDGISALVDDSRSCLGGGGIYRFCVSQKARRKYSRASHNLGPYPGRPVSGDENERNEQPERRTGPLGRTRRCWPTSKKSVATRKHFLIRSLCSLVQVCEDRGRECFNKQSIFEPGRPLGFIRSFVGLTRGRWNFFLNVTLLWWLDRGASGWQFK